MARSGLETYHKWPIEPPSWIHSVDALTQPAITCSKLTVEKLEKGVKYVQTKLTIKKPERGQW